MGYVWPYKRLKYPISWSITAHQEVINALVIVGSGNSRSIAGTDCVLDLAEKTRIKTGCVLEILSRRTQYRFSVLLFSYALFGYDLVLSVFRRIDFVSFSQIFPASLVSSKRTFPRAFPERNI